MDKKKVLSKIVLLLVFVVLNHNTSYATNLALSNNKVNQTQYTYKQAVKAISTKKHTKPRKKKRSRKKRKKKVIKYIGNFRVYAYCPCSRCCGSNAKGITKTGSRAKQGRTIAVDPNIIPLGSTVYIKYNGRKHKFVAEDTGGQWIKGYKIDKFMTSHIACLKWGIKNCKVWVVKRRK